MKKILTYFLILIFICFAIPVIFTTEFSKRVGETANEIIENNVENSIMQESTYDYQKYNTIKLLHADTNKIEEIDLDEYLYGVVSAEMPASFEEEA